ncbi:MAG: regulator [Candidatus Thermoplasmatota archaeon]|nr:regulator [Candidatus Thermoplasmatota archaeon]
MWSYIKGNFRKYPSQMKVLKKFISIGLSVKKDNEGNPRIYCSDIEVKASSVAIALEVDRRAVLDVLGKIISDPELSRFFADLGPVPDFGKVSSRLGLGVLQIVATSAAQPGIISGVSQIISRENISIRQVIVDDPELVDNPKATIVTESPIPGRLLEEMKSVPGVEAVVIL